MPFSQPVLEGSQAIAPGYLSIPEFTVWLLVSLVLGLVSRRSLKNPGCHGFYRFFAFCATAAVVLPNLDYWHAPLYTPRQILSGVLLFSALGLLGSGLYLLKTRGGQRLAHVPRENFAFENTARLVDTEIFAYIRHPMYSSLLLFTWGAWLKHPNWVGLASALIASAALWAAAKSEERENIMFFGDSYRSYIGRTRNFIPFVF